MKILNCKTDVSDEEWHDLCGEWKKSTKDYYPTPSGRLAWGCPFCSLVDDLILLFESEEEARSMWDELNKELDYHDGLEKEMEASWRIKDKYCM